MERKWIVYGVWHIENVSSMSSFEWQWDIFNIWVVFHNISLAHRKSKFNKLFRFSYNISKYFIVIFTSFIEIVSNFINSEKGRYPTWIQAYNVSNGARVWEPFNSTMMKSFICVKSKKVLSFYLTFYIKVSVLCTFLQ